MRLQVLLGSLEHLRSALPVWSVQVPGDGPGLAVVHLHGHAALEVVLQAHLLRRHHLVVAMVGGSKHELVLGHDQARRVAEDRDIGAGTGHVLVEPEHRVPQNQPRATSLALGKPGKVRQGLFPGAHASTDQHDLRRPELALEDLSQRRPGRLADVQEDDRLVLAGSPRPVSLNTHRRCLRAL